jgi:glycosyltransferase 2 family protein
VRAAHQPHLLALAFLCLLVTIPLAALRWWTLLKGLHVVASFRWTLNVTSISLFFHTFLPGAYGGDLVRLGMARRATGASINRLAFSVLVDRLSGLAALLLLGIIMVPSLPDAYASRLELVGAVALGAGIAGLALTLASGEWLADMISRLPAPVGPRLAHVVRELVVALRAYVARPAMLGGAFALSLVQYALVLAALMVLGRAMGIEGLTPSAYVVAGIWSLVANALPITPGGLGVGEATFAHVAQRFASPSALGEAFGTVFLAMRVLSVVIGVVGVLPFLFYRKDVQQGIASTATGKGSENEYLPEAK